MQQRRKKWPFVLALAVLLAGGWIFLGTREFPAPQNRIEKPLDAGKFLNQAEESPSPAAASPPLPSP